MAVCNQCEDVTNATLTSCTPTASKQGQNCNFTTPNSLQVQGWAAGDDYYGFRYTHINSTFSDAYPFCAGSTIPTCISGEGSQDQKDFVTLLDTSIIRFDPKYEDTDNWNPQETRWRGTLEAYECVYQLCLVEYANWTSVNGTVNPGSRRQWPLNGTVDGLDDVVSVMVNYTVLPNEDGDFPAMLEEGGQQVPPQSRILRVNAYDVRNMAQILQNMTHNSYPSGPDDGADVQNGNLPLNRLFNSGPGGLLATLDRLALAMSYEMLSGPNATIVKGELWATQTYIRVHWAWLSLTVTLVALAAGFLAAVAFASRRTQQPLWKSSLAPLLMDHVRLTGGS